MNMFTPMTQVLPPATGFEWAVEHFTVSEADSQKTTWRPREFVPEGDYVRLVRMPQRVVVMSDTWMEQRTNFSVVLKAKGDVFIAGLGLGMILVPICKKPEVKSVTVVELHKEVADLVEAPLRKHLGADASKLTVQLGINVLDYHPPKGLSWNCIYFDIWNTTTTDNLEQMTLLKRRFARRKRTNGWMGCWNEELLRDAKRREVAAGF